MPMVLLKRDFHQNTTYNTHYYMDNDDIRLGLCDTE